MQGDFPRFNVKSTLVPCTDTNYVFLYGGFDENDNLDSNVYLYNMTSRMWEVDSAHTGLYREGHLALYLGDGNVFVFGGVPEDEVPRLDPHADDLTLRKDLPMLMYSVYDRTWQSAPSLFLANAPSCRSRHACCLSEDGRTIYLSGGLINSAPLADLYSYDLKSGTWLGPVEFVARFDHKIAFHDGKLYSFGGLDGEMNHVTNKVTYMNLDDLSLVDVITKEGPRKKPILNSISAGADLFGGPLSIPEYTIHQEKAVDEDTETLPATFEKIWLDSGNPLVKLEVRVPPWGCESHLQGISVTLTNLSSYSSVSLLTQRDIERYFTLNNVISSLNNAYQWRHAFVVKHNLYLLGHANLDPESALAQNNLLSTVLEVNLRDLGIDIQSETEKTPLISDLATFFLSGEYTDFVMFAFKDQETKDCYASSDLNASILMDEGFVAENLLPIPVHKAILLARWPHFRRVIDSGMSETQSGQLFVPEPFSPVRALVYYLYTGTLDKNGVMGPSLTAVEYSALLVLSQLYELPNLASQVLVVLFKLLSSDVFTLPEASTPEDLENTIDSILRIWQNSLILNEEMFMSKVEEIIHNHWSIVSRSRLFMSLSKILIVKLCQNCFDRRNHHSPPPKRDSFDSAFSGTPSPAVQYRKEHSNSPFTKTFDDDFASPHEYLRHSHSLSSFPVLQNIPNSFSDF